MYRQLLLFAAEPAVISTNAGNEMLKLYIVNPRKHSVAILKQLLDLKLSLTYTFIIT